MKNDMIESNEFLKEMKRLVIEHDGDEEVFHSGADDLMCRVLKSLGYTEGVELFKETPKWYA